MSKRGNGRWQNRHPVAFFFLGELVSFAITWIGVLVRNAAEHASYADDSTGQPGIAIGTIIGVVGGLLMLACLVWSLVKLASHVFRRDRTARPVQAVRPGRPGRSARGDHRVPKVKLLMLGDSGAGKSTMLAGLYYRFNLSGRTGIKLVTNHENEGRLESLIDVIQDADNQYFSLGTRPADMRRFEFNVRVEWQGRSATACTLECLDYPGGWVERKHPKAGSGGEEPPSQDFEDALRTADILMAVLDGEKIARLMDGTADWGMVRSFENLVKILDRSGQQDIYLVIAKWDLLPGANGAHYPLRQVLATLEAKSDQFCGFRQSGRLASMRIIPVATLGLNGFARANPAGGGMLKYPDEPWKPWNVELPFFCALPDILTHDLERQQGTVAEITTSVLKATELHLGLARVAEVRIPAGRLLVELWQRVRDMNRQGRKAAAGSDKLALVFFVEQCRELLMEFDEQHPDSVVPRSRAGL
jgi:hypothetical protein